jgi:hypothetical protein
MTANDNHPSGVAASHAEASLTHLFEIVNQAMQIAGWDPKWRVALVLEHEETPDATAYVSNIESAARVRDIAAKYAEQEAERKRVAAEAIQRMKGDRNG